MMPKLDTTHAPQPSLWHFISIILAGAASLLGVLAVAWMSQDFEFAQVTAWSIFLTFAGSAFVAVFLILFAILVEDYRK